MTDIETEYEDTEEESTPQSLIDLIKQDVDDLVNDESTFIPVIGHERTGLAIKYRMPTSGKELDTLARKVERQTKDKYERNLWTAMDTIIILCDGIYVRPPYLDLDDYVMLDPQDEGAPVKIDTRLAGIIGAPEDGTARGVLRKLFGNKETLILNHAERLNRWLNNTKADLTVEVWQLGE